MKMFFKRLYRAFFPEYIIYVNHRGKDRTIHIKDLKKVSPKVIKGITKDDEAFEIFSNEPMDYYLVEYKEDLK
jgi:hypothetical protein